MPAVPGRAALPLVLLLAGCALGGGPEPSANPTARANDFRPAELRQAVVLVRVVIGSTSRLSERDRRELPALYEGALLEALDARAIVVRDLRSVEAGAAVPEPSLAAARAREVGVDHAVVVSLRVEPQIVRVCEDTRRPLRGEATVWRQEARIVRAADAGERVRAQVTTPDVEAKCENSRPSVRPRGVQATAAAAVEQLVGRMLAR